MASELTILLQAANAGDTRAINRLVALLYVDLRRLAHRRSKSGNNTFNTTGLVHECYLRLLRANQLQIRDREHFLCLAARIMRQLLCDHARERLAAKRGGGYLHLSLRASDAVDETEAVQCLALDQALSHLAVLRPLQAKVVECRYFGGLSERETAACLNRSLRAVQQDWADARHWLRKRLSE